MKEKKYEAIVFDLDGTLLNTLEDLMDSVNYALRNCGMQERSYEEIRRFVGNSNTFRIIYRWQSESGKESVRNRHRYGLYYGRLGISNQSRAGSCRRESVCEQSYGGVGVAVFQLMFCLGMRM